MAYPLDMPVTSAPVNMTFRAVSTTAFNESIFTGKQYVLARDKQYWAVDISLPPMKRADAEEWIAFLLQLRGRIGTFKCGPVGESAMPRGFIVPGATVSSDTASGTGIPITGGPIVAQNALRKGDFIEVDSYLYKVLEDVQTGSSGEATVEVWPNVRGVSEDDEVIVENPKSLFRLTTDTISYDLDLAMNYGLQFSAMEAI